MSNLSTMNKQNNNKKLFKDMDKIDYDKQLDIYKKIIGDSNFRYIVKYVNDKKQDIVISDEKCRYDLVKDTNLGITDIYDIDCAFDCIKYDLYINFFYSNKKLINNKQPNYQETVINAYKDIIKTDKFKKFLFIVLDIDDEIFLQERYLFLAQSFFISHANNHINIITPKSDKVIDLLTKGYTNVINHFNYKFLVKYVNNDTTNIFISSSKVRKNVMDSFIDNFENLYDFENEHLIVLTGIVYNNYILANINKTGYVPKKRIENLIYNNDVCMSVIKNSLQDHSEHFNKYLKIIIQNIYAIINY